MILIYKVLQQDHQEYLLRENYKSTKDPELPHSPGMNQMSKLLQVILEDLLLFVNTRIPNGKVS